MTLKECSLASSTLLYHRAMAKRAASLTVFFEKIIRREWHKPYALWMSGYSLNSITALCFCFSVHLLADLNTDSGSVSAVPYGYRRWDIGTVHSPRRTVLPPPFPRWPAVWHPSGA